MPEALPPIMLLSSNRRRQYSQDILTALASPPGTVIRFRYRENYVAPSLRQIISDRSVIGRSAIIGFIATMGTDKTPDSPDILNPVMVPVRLVTITSAENVADIYIFQLCVLGYPDLNELPMSLADLSQESKKFHDKLVESNGAYYPAVVKCPNLRLSAGSDPAQSWIGIVQRLTQHPTFGASYFVRVGSPVSAGRRKVAFGADGQLRLGDGQSVKLPVAFYSDTYFDSDQVSLSCTTDDRYLRLSSASKYDVASRYDSVEFWLQPRTETYDTKAAVTIRLAYGDTNGVAVPPDAGKPVPLTTNIDFPVLVVRSRSRLALKIAASAVGAAFVALPGILGQPSPLAVRIAAAIVGALILAYSTNMMSRF
jgi:hypothetical protein